MKNIPLIFRDDKSFSSKRGQDNALDKESFCLRPGWYLIYCKYNQEHRACVSLSDQKITHYFPTININGAKHWLFPQYAFVYLSGNTSEQYRKIKNSRGVKDFIRLYCLYQDKNPLPLPIHNGDKLIEDIQHIEKIKSFNINTDTTRGCSAGDELLISNSLYQSLKATFIHHCGKHRALVLLEHLQHSRVNSGIKQSLLGSKLAIIPTGMLAKKYKQ